MKNSINNIHTTTEPSHHHEARMLSSISHFPRCPPRVPTPRERLAGVLADLETLAAQAWAEREEVAAVLLGLHRALVAMGVRDRMIHIPTSPGWVRGEALRPVVAQFRMAFRSLGVT